MGLSGKPWLLITIKQVEHCLLRVCSLNIRWYSLNGNIKTSGFKATAKSLIASFIDVEGAVLTAKSQVAELV